MEKFALLSFNCSKTHYGSQHWKNRVRQPWTLGGLTWHPLTLCMMSLNQLLKPPSNYSRNIQVVDPYTLAAHHNVVMSFQDRPTQKAAAFSTSCCSTDSKRPYHRYHLPNKVRILISHRIFLKFTLGREMPLNCPFTSGTWPPSNVWFLPETASRSVQQLWQCSWLWAT